ncbi:MAG TPA: PAS domain-containing protein [Anaerolineales bacterium]|nr:PAS domain-containing protein [Anaerolineales bacterium]
MNQKLNQARHLFYALFHANPIPTSLTHLENGLLIDANDAYLSYYGFTREALIGHTSKELYLPIDPRLIIRHRLSLLGCNLDVESQSGKGTKAIIEVPYEKMDS